MIKEGRFIGTSMERVNYHENETAANKLSGIIKNETNDIKGDSREGLKNEFVRYFTGGRSTSTLASFFKTEPTQVRDVLRLALRTIMTFVASSLRPQLHRGLIRSEAFFENFSIKIEFDTTELLLYFLTLISKKKNFKNYRSKFWVSYKNTQKINNSDIFSTFQDR
jgi:hypothetical protein